MVWAGEVWSWVKGKYNDLSLCSFILMPPQLPERHKVAEAGLVRPVGVRKMTERWGCWVREPSSGMAGHSPGWRFRRPGPRSALCSESKPRTRHTL